LFVVIQFQADLRSILISLIDVAQTLVCLSQSDLDEARSKWPTLSSSFAVIVPCRIQCRYLFAHAAMCSVSAETVVSTYAVLSYCARLSQSLSAKLQYCCIWKYKVFYCCRIL